VTEAVPHFNAILKEANLLLNTPELIVHVPQLATQELSALAAPSGAGYLKFHNQAPSPTTNAFFDWMAGTPLHLHIKVSRYLAF
jgi:hypothetical protein